MTKIKTLDIFFKKKYLPVNKKKNNQIQAKELNLGLHQVNKSQLLKICSSQSMQLAFHECLPKTGVQRNYQNR